jgi:hypothetical protein
MPRRLALGFVLLVACDRGEPRTPTGARDAAAPPPPVLAANHFDAIVDGQPMKLRHAKAVVGASGVAAREGLTIVLSDRDQTCEAVVAAPGDAPLSVEVPPGPGDTYFVGGPATAQAVTRRAVEGLPGVRAWDVRLALDPFVPRAGARLTGTLDIEAVAPTAVRVHGRLDVEICETPTPVGLPTTAPDAPAGGAWRYADRARNPVYRSGLVFLDPGDDAVFHHVGLFEAADVPCASGREPGGVVSTADAHLDFADVRTRQPPLGVILPAKFSIPGSDVDTIEAHAWIRIDDLAVDRGELRFAMAARRADDSMHLQVEVAGAVAARLCPP